MQICSKCNVEKDFNAFAFKNKSLNKRRTDCKKCFSELTKAHYLKNKKSYKKSTRKARLKVKSIINSLKEQSPCVDCNVQHPYYVMDFDHKDRTTKYKNISIMVNECSLRSILEEIKKCDLVCANCHRIRTFTRKDFG